MKEYSNRKIIINSDKLECNNELKLSEINNNMPSLGNNLNKDILTEVQMVQNNLKKELNDVKKINLTYSNSNKIDLSSPKTNNEYIKEVNKRKIKNNKNNIDKNNYKDIPLTKFFQ